MQQLGQLSAFPYPVAALDVSANPGEAAVAISDARTQLSLWGPERLATPTLDNTVPPAADLYWTATNPDVTAQALNEAHASIEEASARASVRAAWWGLATVMGVGAGVGAAAHYAWGKSPARGAVSGAGIGAAVIYFRWLLG